MDNVDMKSPFKSPTTHTTAIINDQFLSPSNYEGDANGGDTSSNIDENEPPAGMISDHVGELVNPFEKEVLAGLQNSFWSPSIMDIKETPPQRSWAIEHLSHLFPKDIENSPTSHQNAFPVDEQAETKAQADINTYFSRGQIVPTPSPMKERVKTMNFASDMMRYNKANMYVQCVQSPIARGVGGMGQSNGLIIKKKKLTSVTERWTQTTLSFPSVLPPHIEEILAQYSTQDDEMCGSSNATTYYSQRSEISENNDVGEYDTGKNASSLNNSIRRRLELSFGDDPDGEDSSNSAQQDMYSVDPFRSNHIMSTPPGNNPVAQNLNTTTSELEVQLMRCEFTPEARGMYNSVTPGITPIADDADEPRFNQTTASTPKRSHNNSFNFKRWGIKEGPASPVAGSSSNNAVDVDRVCTENDDSKEGSNDSKINIMLRRSRTYSSTGNVSKRISSASSFDDSQYLMEDSSPPAKLYRRHSDNNTS